MYFFMSAVKKVFKKIICNTILINKYHYKWFLLRAYGFVLLLFEDLKLENIFKTKYSRYIEGANDNKKNL